MIRTGTTSLTCDAQASAVTENLPLQKKARLKH
jgi:hypothetical protein